LIVCRLGLRHRPPSWFRGWGPRGKGRRQERRKRRQGREGKGEEGVPE